MEDKDQLFSGSARSKGCPFGRQTIPLSTSISLPNGDSTITAPRVLYILALDNLSNGTYLGQTQKMLGTLGYDVKPSKFKGEL